MLLWVAVRSRWRQTNCWPGLRVDVLGCCGCRGEHHATELVFQPLGLLLVVVAVHGGQALYQRLTIRLTDVVGAIRAPFHLRICINCDRWSKVTVAHISFDQQQPTIMRCVWHKILIASLYESHLIHVALAERSRINPGLPTNCGAVPPVYTTPRAGRGGRWPIRHELQASAPSLSRTHLYEHTHSHLPDTPASFTRAKTLPYRYTSFCVHRYISAAQGIHSDEV